MIQLADYLHSTFEVSSSDIESITPYFKPVRLKKNEYFLRSGNRVTQIAFITSGVMRNYSINPEGNEVVHYMTTDGDFNTVYQYFINEKPCPENIQAVTSCELAVIEREDFFRIREKSKVFETLVENLVLDGLNCKEKRLRSYLAENAQKRYANLLTHQPKIIQYSPMQYIASYLGITRETLSRIRNRKVSRV